MSEPSTITKPNGALDAVLIITQDATGSRLLDEIITQQDATIATGDVHADTDIIDVMIDIPTGARIRFKTTNALPAGLPGVDTICYAIRISETDQGTGTHTVQQLVKWPGGTKGTLQTGKGLEDILKLHYKTADEQWYAEALIANLS